MKNLIFILLCLLFVSCNQQDKTELVTDNPCAACGVKDARNIPWLKELIGKAENDKTGNYMGTIWLEKYNGQDVFVTNMALGSGGIAYYFFDCSKKDIVPQKTSLEFNNFMMNMKLNVVIYSNVPF